MPPEDEVRKTSKRFYEALNSMLKGDAAPLADVWSHSAGVTTMHPIGGRDVGWGKVEGSWTQVAKAASEGHVKLNDQLIQVGSDIAYEVGTEQGDAVLGGHKVKIDQRVTNIYRKEAGGWKVVHHHTDMSPGMVDVVSRHKGAP